MSKYKKIFVLVSANLLSDPCAYFAQVIYVVYLPQTELCFLNSALRLCLSHIYHATAIIV